jgi:hypothetical protein
MAASAKAFMLHHAQPKSFALHAEFYCLLPWGLSSDPTV